VTTQISEPISGQLTETEQRARYMAALKLATQIMADTPVIPSDFTIVVSKWAIGETEIRFYFHRNPEALQQFADERFMAVTGETREDGAHYAEAHSLVAGLLVKAWTLLPAEVASAVAA
jgi:hypothetical protein